MECSWDGCLLSTHLYFLQKEFLWVKSLRNEALPCIMEDYSVGENQQNSSFSAHVQALPQMEYKITKKDMSAYSFICWAPKCCIPHNSW